MLSNKVGERTGQIILDVGMTWVVGATTLFGYGVMVSDVCVTLADGTTRDVVRKSYPIGRFILGGFAGSVKIGFEMLADLQGFLRFYPGEEEYCWEPEWVAENWPARARQVFSRHEEAEQSSGSHVMIVGVQPAPAEQSVLGGGWPVVAVFRHPDFAPDIVKGGCKVASIGSGSGQAEAMDLLEKSVANVDMMIAEVSNPGGFGRYIASGMTRDLFFDARQGVSRHMHVSIVGINSLYFGNNDTTYIPSEGPEIPLRMPKVAENFPELCKMLGGGDAARGAQADSAAERRPGIERLLVIA